MSIIIPYANLAGLADDGYPTAMPGPVLHLYSNNLTPLHTTGIGAFTECADADYASVALSAWPVPVFDGVDRATYTFDPITFDFAAAGNIYGYYVTDTGVTDLYWSERRASSPIPFVTFNGATYTVYPVISFKVPIV